MDGGPGENKARFCHACGGKIWVRAALAARPEPAAAVDLSQESTVRLVEVLVNLLEQLTHDA